MNSVLKNAQKIKLPLSIYHNRSFLRDLIVILPNGENVKSFTTKYIPRFRFCLRPKSRKCNRDSKEGGCIIQKNEKKKKYNAKFSEILNNFQPTGCRTYSSTNLTKKRHITYPVNICYPYHRYQNLIPKYFNFYRKNNYNSSLNKNESKNVRSTKSSFENDFKADPMKILEPELLNNPFEAKIEPEMIDSTNLAVSSTKQQKNIGESIKIKSDSILFQQEHTNRINESNSKSAGNLKRKHDDSVKKVVKDVLCRQCIHDDYCFKNFKKYDEGCFRIKEKKEDFITSDQSAELTDFLYIYGGGGPDRKLEKANFNSNSINYNVSSNKTDNTEYSAPPNKTAQLDSGYLFKNKEFNFDKDNEPYLSKNGSPTRIHPKPISKKSQQCLKSEWKPIKINVQKRCIPTSQQNSVIGKPSKSTTGGFQGLFNNVYNKIIGSKRNFSYYELTKQEAVLYSDVGVSLKLKNNYPWNRIKRPLPINSSQSKYNWILSRRLYSSFGTRQLLESVKKGDLTIIRHDSDDSKCKDAEVCTVKEGKPQVLKTYKRPDQKQICKDQSKNKCFIMNGVDASNYLAKPGEGLEKTPLKNALDKKDHPMASAMDKPIVCESDDYEECPPGNGNPSAALKRVPYSPKENLKASSDKAGVRCFQPVPDTCPKGSSADFVAKQDTCPKVKCDPPSPPIPPACPPNPNEIKKTDTGPKASSGNPPNKTDACTKASSGNPPNKTNTTTVPPNPNKIIKKDKHTDAKESNINIKKDSIKIDGNIDIKRDTNIDIKTDANIDIKKDKDVVDPMDLNPIELNQAFSNNKCFISNISNLIEDFDTPQNAHVYDLCFKKNTNISELTKSSLKETEINVDKQAEKIDDVKVIENIEKVDLDNVAPLTITPTEVSKFKSVAKTLAKKESSLKETEISGEKQAEKIDNVKVIENIEKVDLDNVAPLTITPTEVSKFKSVAKTLAKKESSLKETEISGEKQAEKIDNVKVEENIEKVDLDNVAPLTITPTEVSKFKSVAKTLAKKGASDQNITLRSDLLPKSTTPLPDPKPVSREIFISNIKTTNFLSKEPIFQTSTSEQFPIELKKYNPKKPVPIPNKGSKNTKAGKKTGKKTPPKKSPPTKQAPSKKAPAQKVEPKKRCEISKPTPKKPPTSPKSSPKTVQQSPPKPCDCLPKKKPKNPYKHSKYPSPHLVCIPSEPKKKGDEKKKEDKKAPCGGRSSKPSGGSKPKFEAVNEEFLNVKDVSTPIEQYKKLLTKLQKLDTKCQHFKQILKEKKVVPPPSPPYVKKDSPVKKEYPAYLSIETIRELRKKSCDPIMMYRKEQVDPIMMYRKEQVTPKKQSLIKEDGIYLCKIEKIDSNQTTTDSNKIASSGSKSTSTKTLSCRLVKDENNMNIFVCNEVKTEDIQKSTQTIPKKPPRDKNATTTETKKLIKPALTYNRDKNLITVKYMGVKTEKIEEKDVVKDESSDVSLTESLVLIGNKDKISKTFKNESELPNISKENEKVSNNNPNDEVTGLLFVSDTSTPKEHNIESNTIDFPEINLKQELSDTEIDTDTVENNKKTDLYFFIENSTVNIHKPKNINLPDIKICANESVTKNNIKEPIDDVSKINIPNVKIDLQPKSEPKPEVVFVEDKPVKEEIVDKKIEETTYDNSILIKNPDKATSILLLAKENVPIEDAINTYKKLSKTNLIEDTLKVNTKEDKNVVGNSGFKPELLFFNQHNPKKTQLGDTKNTIFETDNFVLDKDLNLVNVQKAEDPSLAKTKETTPNNKFENVDTNPTNAINVKVNASIKNNENTTHIENIKPILTPGVQEMGSISIKLNAKINPTEVNDNNISNLKLILLKNKELDKDFSSEVSNVEETKSKAVYNNNEDLSVDLLTDNDLIANNTNKNEIKNINEDPVFNMKDEKNVNVTDVIPYRAKHKDLIKYDIDENTKK